MAYLLLLEFKYLYPVNQYGANKKKVDSKFISSFIFRYNLCK